MKTKLLSVLFSVLLNAPFGSAAVAKPDGRVDQSGHEGYMRRRWGK